MEDLVERWLEQNKENIEAFFAGLPEYKARNLLTKVTGTPVINILMLPANRSARRFSVANVVSRDEEQPGVVITPSEGQEFSMLLTEKLNAMYPQGEFTIKRNKEFAIYLKFSEVTPVVGVI